METLTLSRDQMQPRIARFRELKPAVAVAGRTGRLPEDLRAALMSQTVYGLTSPSGEGERNFWDSAAVPAGTPNFGAVYVRARTGAGAGWHVHRYSYENFVAMQGTWRIFWNGPENEEHVDLEPFDMVSIPPGAIRRFEYVGEGEGVLMAFAYAAEHSLMDSKEIWTPPCEIDRIAAEVEGKGDFYDDYIRQTRARSADASAATTEADRAFSRQVAEFVGAG
jgi:mannose-6-phosphate isomerase-like protein (cupin superfamily)